MEIAELYMQLRDDLAFLVLDNSARSDSPVPACPEWTVRDVLAHVAGLAQDAVSGDLPALDLLEQWRDVQTAATRDDMTADQVRRSARDAVEDVVVRWESVSDALAPMLNGARPFPGRPPVGIEAVLVTDLVLHDQDVRGALGEPRLGMGSAESLALATYAFGVDYRVRQLALPALELRYGEKARLLGEGEPAAVVTAERFELVRAFGGRRSRDQILALDWLGDPMPYVELIPAYGERRTDLIE